MNSAVTHQLRLVIDRPAGSARIARQRLHQTLQRERLLAREHGADQALLLTLLTNDLPTTAREGSFVRY